MNYKLELSLEEIDFLKEILFHQNKNKILNEKQEAMSMLISDIILKLDLAEELIE